MGATNSKRKQTGFESKSGFRSNGHEESDTSSTSGGLAGQTMTRSQSHGSGNNSCNQVVYEIQECHEGGEAELGKAYDDCEKNPGHDKFIPVNDFSLEHLPADYQDNDIFKSIQCQQFLTCRLRVKYSSKKRPEYFPVSKVPYPCYKDRGKSSHSHTGSGWVEWVEKITEEENRRLGIEPLTCPYCVSSYTPCKEWFQVYVATAKHVTFDDHEVRQTEVELFFDDKKRKKIKKLHGWKMVYDGKDIEDDICDFICYTHDMELGQSLMEMVERFRNLNDKIQSKFYPTRKPVDPIEHPLIVIVSHPHGCHKQISFGEWKETPKDYAYYIKYKYTATTCLGSSGARVWTIRYWHGFSYWQHPHSKYCEDGLNMSGIGFFH